MSSLTLPIILISCLIPFAIMVLARRATGANGPKQRILQTGLPARATVMTIAPTGTVINSVNYMCRLQLRVFVTGRLPYDVVTKELLPITAMASYPAGCSVAVKVDPDKPEHVVLDRSVIPTMPAASVPSAGPGV